MNPTSNFIRFGIVTALTALSACAGSPTTPTPPPVPTVDPPTIVCPMPTSVTSPLGGEMSVDYAPPVVSGGVSPVTVTCTPASGSSFPVSSTTVTCTALDAKQQASSCIFTVTVTPPPQLSLTRFIAFGDSITYGEDGTNPATMNRFSPLLSILLFGREYPTDLQVTLRARYTLQSSAIFVRNDGLPGEYARDPATVTRFSRDVTSGGQQVVLLMEGANDVIESYRSGSSVTAAALVNLRQMVRLAKSAGVRPYLASLPPQNPNSACIPTCRGFAAALVPGFNDSLRAVAGAEDVTFVDVYSAFDGDLTLISGDGLHPNAAGYQRIADAFDQALKSTLEQVPLMTPARTSSRTALR